MHLQRPVEGIVEVGFVKDFRKEKVDKPKEEMKEGNTWSSLNKGMIFSMG